MTFHEALVAQLILHEGLRLKPYVDTVGRLTIGVGRNLDDKGISRFEAMDLLSHDLAECIADLDIFQWFARLDPIRQRAVIDLRFNLGPQKFRGFVNLIHALERGDYSAAADHLAQSKWVTQTGTRATDLITMMRLGVDPHAIG